MSLLSSGVAFLPESECKSIADFRPVQAFCELFFENIHKSLILRKMAYSQNSTGIPPLRG